VAAQVSPAGPRAAGRFGCGLLSIGATTAGGFDVLGSHWAVMEERAAEFSTTVDRNRWRLVGPMHIADTKEQAVADVAFGLEEWVDYFQRVAALPLAPNTENFASLVDALNASGFAVIGTVDDAIAQIARLQDQSGGFGTFLLMGHEWADTEATRHSYELISRYVAPQFQDSATSLVSSRDWAAENRPEFIGAAGTAVMSAIQQHHEERAQKAERAAASTSTGDGEVKSEVEVPAPGA
jgi:limonene 1,2-monooxygenase